MPFTSIHPDRLELRFGGGAASLLGLPFFLVGIAIIAATIAAASGSIEADLPLLFGLLFGSVFALVGYGIVFGRSGLIGDRHSGELVKWWGLPMPVRRVRYVIAHARVVRISREIRRSNKSSYVVFPVSIEFEGAKALKVAEPRQDLKARQTAEQVAKFLQIPLADATSGETVTRSPDELDMNIRQRFEQGRITAPIPGVPGNLKPRIDYDGSTLDVSIPPAGPRPSYVLGLIATLVFAAFAGIGILAPLLVGSGADRHESALIGAFAFVFLAIPLGVAFRMVALMFLVRESLRATAQQVEHSSGWLWRRKKTMPAETIEEIELSLDPQTRGIQGARAGSSSAITLRSDTQTIRFGRHLSPEEKEYLLALLRAALVS